MFINNLCPPALIYLIFSLVQIVIDTLNGLYNTAFVKVWIAILFTSLLNILCERGLSVISWLIVFLPFMFMATLTTILLVSFGMDPYSGKVFKTTQTTNNIESEQNISTVAVNNNVASKQGDFIMNEDGLTHAHMHTHADGSQHAHVHTHASYSSADHDGDWLSGINNH